MSNPINNAEVISVSAPTPVISASPVVLPAPGRAVDLQMRVSAPLNGRDLPIILLSHGHGHSNYLPSLSGYGPLVNFWAAHSFVSQLRRYRAHPSEFDDSERRSTRRSRRPRGPMFWRPASGT